MPNWISSVCNEKSGFLFSHRCDRIQRHVCSRCQRPVCNEHAHETSAQSYLCTTCLKKRRARRSKRDQFDYDDSPYFYGSRYGGHWYGSHHRGGHIGDMHDPHDFTAADAESLHAVGDNEFESDMTDS